MFAAFLAASAIVSAQPPQVRGGPQPEFLRQGRQLERDGKLDEALAVYRKELQASPDSAVANNAAGSVLDLMGQGAEARKYFAKAIDLADTPQSKAQAQRTMAMSYAFDGDCKNTARYEQMVIDYWVTQEKEQPQDAFYQEGEMADEAARVCIDYGDLASAAEWYKKGHDMGIQEPNIAPGRKDLWGFRWEHAQARVAARRGNQAEAQKHVAAAKAVLDDLKGKDSGLYQQQTAFLPYLTGYVAFYSGDYKTALEDLQKANQNDAFIQCLVGQTLEKLGEKDKAAEYYRKAAAASAHNPPAAFGRPFARKKLAGV
jgi:tetratricopeptide (TPR) repeat protein